TASTSLASGPSAASSACRSSGSRSRSAAPTTRMRSSRQAVIQRRAAAGGAGGAARPAAGARGGGPPPRTGGGLAGGGGGVGREPQLRGRLATRHPRRAADQPQQLELRAGELAPRPRRFGCPPQAAPQRPDVLEQLGRGGGLGGGGRHSEENSSVT